jgi:hypothetical protein
MCEKTVAFYRRLMAENGNRRAPAAT